MEINNKEYDLMNLHERKEVIQFLKGSKAMVYPSLSELLIGRVRVFNTETANLAFTIFNPKTTFFEIYLNFKTIKEENYDFNFVQFLVWHELMHNFFRHFVRPKLLEVGKINHSFLNVLEDTIINEYLDKSLKLLDSKNICNLNFNYKILFDNVPQKYKDRKTFKDDEIVSVEELIEIFHEMFEIPDMQQLMQMLKQMQGENEGGESEQHQNGKGAGKQLDDHELSEKMSMAAQQSNESAEEGEDSANSNMTGEQIEATVKEVSLTQADIDEMAKQAVTEAIESAKRRGKEVTKEEERLFKLITLPENQFDFVKLRNVIKAALGGSWTRTYKKIHRHKEFYTGVPYKGKVRTQPKRAIFAIDTSGSVSEKELTYMLSALYTYVKKNKEQVVVDVIAWSSSLDNHYKNIHDAKQLPKLKMGSTGGTEISYLFNHLEEEFPEEKLTVIVVTDGYISEEKYNEEIINDLYFGLTENTMKDVKRWYPKSKCIKLKYTK